MNRRMMPLTALLLASTPTPLGNELVIPQAPSNEQEQKSFSEMLSESKAAHPHLNRKQRRRLARRK